MNGRFKAVIEAAEDGGFLASCHEFPGARGQGETQQAAEESLAAAVQLILLNRSEEEARWLAEAAYLGLAKAPTLVAWADAWIMALDKPPLWLIDLSLTKSKDTAFHHAGDLRIGAPARLKTSESVSLVIASYEHQLIGLEDALTKIFKICLPGAYVAPELPEYRADDDLVEHGPLPDILVEWDCRRDVEPLPEDFKTRCADTFKAHVAQHGAAPDLPIFSR